MWPTSALQRGAPGELVENLRQTHWTLSARVDGRVLEFSLGDGRRLAWHARLPADLLRHAKTSLLASELLGVELAGRLSGSAPRPLSVLYADDGALDDIDWEHLNLGAMRLAEHFGVGRQLISDRDIPSSPDLAKAKLLAVCVVHGVVVQVDVVAQRVPFDALDQPWARDAIASAHVIVLDGVQLSSFMEQCSWPLQRRLLLLTGPAPTRHMARAQDSGAAVLCLARSVDFAGKAMDGLLRQLSGGLSLGEMVTWLHRRAAPERFDGRLYGDPELCFVHPDVPTSRRQVTSLSFDMVGSTAMITERGDEAYAETLAAVHARCTEIVRRHGGQPDDPQGDDGVMGYFGHPVAIENAAVRAVEAGLGIVHAVAELGVAVRVGIATGLVAVKGGQPVGLSIHLAARLQQAAAPARKPALARPQ